MTQTFRRLNEFDVERVVLFSGHFADEQLAMIDSLAAEWNALDLFQDRKRRPGPDAP